MRGRPTDRLDCVAGISVILAVVDTALVAASYPPFSTRSTGIHGWPLVNIAGLGSAVLGAVILGAQPRQPIGWILNLIGLSTSISLAAESYGDLGAPVRRPRLRGAGAPRPAGSPRSSEVRWRWPASPSSSSWCPRARTCRPGGAGSPARPGRRTASMPCGLVLVGPHGINRNGDPIDAGLVALASCSAAASS